MTAMQPATAVTSHDQLDEVIDQIGTIVLGKDVAIRLVMACILGRGHILIEDLPGMGKTTLAQAFARSMGLQFQRIQFTSDLLPADIIGAAVYERHREGFVFHAGPIFSQLVLADEMNRATPKTQSALLEAMEEHQVTIEGETRRLPEPFFVIATQNPAHHVGTFRLPESQLDRFLMCIDLGYPDTGAERELLAGQDRRELIGRLPVRLGPPQLLSAQRRLPAIHVDARLLDYLQALLARSRQSPEFRVGLSPRAGLAILRAARAWALLERRDFVLPEDVKSVLPAVIGHRLHPADEHLDLPRAELVRRVIESVPVPR